MTWVAEWPKSLPYGKPEKLMNFSQSDIYRPITLNTWHKVRIIRNGLESSLQLDSDPYISGRSPAPMTSLNLGEPLMVGGFR